MNHGRAQIYKSDQRGREESEMFRRLSTFNFGEYEEMSRNPFGSLLVLNDETLGAGNNIFRHIEQDTEIVLLPLVGGLLYKDSLGNEDIIATEEIRLVAAQKGSHYQLINPYENDLINYLQIWLRPAITDFTSQSEQKSFDFTIKNVLIPIFFPIDSSESTIISTANSYGFIGIYEGRKEGNYTLKNPKNGLFAFVINGAFEFENRLLESRDGLSICKIETAAFEALSENAILLLLEIPL